MTINNYFERTSTNEDVEDEQWDSKKYFSSPSKIR